MNSQNYWFFRPYLLFVPFGILAICVMPPQAYLRQAFCEGDCIAFGADRLWTLTYIWATSGWAIICGTFVCKAYERKLRKAHQEKYFPQTVNRLQVREAPSQLISNLCLLTALAIPIGYVSIHNTYLVMPSGVILADGKLQDWSDVRRIDTSCYESCGRFGCHWQITYNLSFNNGEPIDLSTLNNVVGYLPRAIDALKQNASNFKFNASAVVPQCGHVLAEVIRHKP